MSEPDVSLPDHGLTPEDFPGATTLTQEAIDAAVDAVRRLADWHVWPERAETLYVDAPGDKLVVLPTKRLVSVESVTVDGREVEIGEQDFSPDGTLWIASMKPHPQGRPRRVVAEVVHGFAVPGDVLALVRSMAGRASAPGQAYQVGRINVGAPGAVTPQSTEWRIIDQIRLGPLP